MASYDVCPVRGGIAAVLTIDHGHTNAPRLRATLVGWPIDPLPGRLRSIQIQTISQDCVRLMSGEVHTQLHTREWHTGPVFLTKEVA